MKLTLQAVQVVNGHDEEGRLVFADGRLIAVLVQLSDMHEDLGVAGHWFLESGYGFRWARERAVFPDLEAAQAWISQRLVRRS